MKIDIQKHPDIIKLYDGGLSLRQISKQYNVTPKAIHNILLKYDVVFRTKGDYGVVVDRDILYDLYINKKLTLEEIGQYFNTGNGTIKLKLNEYKIQRRKPILEEAREKCIICGGIKTHKNGYNQRAGKKYSQRYFCFDCNKSYTPNLLVLKERSKKYHNEIIKLYNEGYSSVDIGEKFGISNVGISRILRKYDLSRSLKESKRFTDKWKIKMYESKRGRNYEDYLRQLPAYKKYRRAVTTITNKQLIQNLSNFDKRGKAGTENAFHLDHKFSVLEGFKQGIAPEIIGGVKNLQFIPWKDNLTKNSKCSISLDEII